MDTYVYRIMYDIIIHVCHGCVEGTVCAYMWYDLFA